MTHGEDSLAAPRKGPTAGVRALAVAATLAVLAIGGLVLRTGFDPPGARSVSHDLTAIPLPPEGRIVAAQKGQEAATLHFRSRALPHEVMQYYRLSLPDLGWREIELAWGASEGDMLAFSRGRRTCIMRVSETSRGAETAVTVVVQERDAAGPNRLPYEERKP